MGEHAVWRCAFQTNPSSSQEKIQTVLCARPEILFLFFKSAVADVCTKDTDIKIALYFSSLLQFGNYRVWLIRDDIIFEVVDFGGGFIIYLVRSRHGKSV
jgi:hypothetical protein